MISYRPDVVVPSSRTGLPANQDPQGRAHVDVQSDGEVVSAVRQTAGQKLTVATEVIDQRVPRVFVHAYLFRRSAGSSTVARMFLEPAKTVAVVGAFTFE